MKLRDIMTRDVALVSPDTSLKEAAAKMRETDSGFLPVGENDRLVGTLTDRDIAIRAVAEGRDPSATKVRDAMSEHIVYCFDDQEHDEAAKLMAEKQIKRLAVLNRDKRLVGVVSLGDVADRTHDQGSIARAEEGIARPGGKGA